MSNKRLDTMQSSSLADRARDMIRSAIFDGRIAPDERLTIEHIAAELGISRTPVREALKALETDGIVKLLPNRGAIVQRYDKPEIQDRYTVRAVLEGLTGELACRNKAAVLTPLLQRNCEELEASIATTNLDDLHAVGKLVLLNSEFHSLILDASASPTAMRTLATLQMPMAYRVYTWRSRDRALVSLEFHKEIVSAFSRNDPKLVRKLMEDHICDARDFLVSDEIAD
jgi:GntR family transcriptional regulator, vanillate catabolism transcriptional regulator